MKREDYYLSLCIVMAAITTCDSARILGIFPVPSISHQVVFRALSEGLAKRGHELIVLTTDPAYPENKHPFNITEIDVHDESYRIFIEYWVKAGISNMTPLQVSLEFYNSVTKSLFRILDYQFTRDKIQDILINPKDRFDLVLVEDFCRVCFYFGHALKTPVIAVSSLVAQSSTLNAVGAPLHPIFYKELYTHRIDVLNLYDKIYEMLLYLSNMYSFWRLEEPEYEFGKKYFGKDIPSMVEMQRAVDMVFVNVNPVWIGARPMPPNVIYMGGIHKKPPQEIEENLKNWLDSSKNGVIYMSLGSNVKSSRDIPLATVKEILRVFKDLPYDVLWKWETGELEGKPDNVKLAKWLPQNDLLNHPKVKAFITQAGLQSIDEAIAANVPMVAVPFFGDQFVNAERCVMHNIGVHLDKDHITYDALKSALELVTGNKTYQESIRRLSELLQDEPMRPLDRAIWWTEYVIRHQGAGHLRSPAATVSLAEYYMLDVLGLLLVSALLAFVVLKASVSFLVKALCSKRRKIKKN